MTRKRTAHSTGRQLADLMAAAPEVVAIRTSRMAAMTGHGSHRDRREMARMVMEKGAAAQETWLGVATEIALANQKVFAATLGAFWSGPFRWPARVHRRPWRSGWARFPRTRSSVR